MAAELRVDTVKSRSGINTFSFTGDSGFTFDTNTGIGTTNPTSKLHVDGTALITGVTTFRGDVHITGFNSVGIGTDIPNNDLTVSDTIQPSYAPSAAGEYIEIARSSGGDAGFLINKNTGQWLIGIDNSDGANAPLRFEYGAAGSAHPGLGAGTLGMFMKHDGNIGIGTDTPTGRVQIDTTSGGRALTVNAPTNGTYITFETANTAYADIGSEAGAVGSGSTDLLVLNARSTRDLAFRTNSAERLRINSSGNIGIGTDTPGTKLDILNGSDAAVIATINGADSSSEYLGFGINSGEAVITAGGNGSTSNALVFRTAPSGTETERLRITSTGDVVLGQGSTVGSSAGVVTYFGDGSNLTGIAAGGSGTFDTGISTSVIVPVTAGIGTDDDTNRDIFVGPGIAYSFPSTASTQYVIESIHVVNKSGGNLYVSGRHDINGGANVPLANRVIVPYNGAVELLEEPHVANLSDIIRLQALTGTGTSATGANNGLDAFITYSTKSDSSDYIGVAQTITSTDQEFFEVASDPCVLQSLNLVNYSNTIDVDVSVSIFSGGTTGGIATTGIRRGYLAYNLTVPRNSTIELFDKPKRLESNQALLITASSNNQVGVLLSGRYITS